MCLWNSVRGSGPGGASGKGHSSDLSLTRVPSAHKPALSQGEQDGTAATAAPMGSDRHFASKLPEFALLGRGLPSQVPLSCVNLRASVEGHHTFLFLGWRALGWCPLFYYMYCGSVG